MEIRIYRSDGYPNTWADHKGDGKVAPFHGCSVRDVVTTCTRWPDGLGRIELKGVTLSLTIKLKGDKK